MGGPAGFLLHIQRRRQGALREPPGHDVHEGQALLPAARGRVFSRKKVARLERNKNRLSLYHSMFDQAHGFEIRYVIDLDVGTIVQAESETPRLPYMGICDEPQKKIASLVGQRADRELKKRIQTLIGGSAGCAQLYDLTSDLLKLLSFD